MSTFGLTKFHKHCTRTLASPLPFVYLMKIHYAYHLEAQLVNGAEVAIRIRFLIRHVFKIL